VCLKRVRGSVEGGREEGREGLFFKAICMCGGGGGGGGIF
jgi:hypothetical protein